MRSLLTRSLHATLPASSLRLRHASGHCRPPHRGPGCVVSVFLMKTAHPRPVLYALPRLCRRASNGSRTRSGRRNAKAGEPSTPHRDYPHPPFSGPLAAADAFTPRASHRSLDVPCADVIWASDSRASGRGYRLPYHSRRRWLRQARAPTQVSEKRSASVCILIVCVCDGTRSQGPSPAPTDSRASPSRVSSRTHSLSSLMNSGNPTQRRKARPRTGQRVAI